jgi:hypothetical protein
MVHQRGRDGVPGSRIARAARCQAARLRTLVPVVGARLVEGQPNPASPLSDGMLGASELRKGSSHRPHHHEFERALVTSRSHQALPGRPLPRLCHGSGPCRNGSRKTPAAAREMVRAHHAPCRRPPPRLPRGRDDAPAPRARRPPRAVPPPPILGPAPEGPMHPSSPTYEGRHAACVPFRGGWPFPYLGRQIGSSTWSGCPGGISDRYVPRHPDISVLHVIVRRYPIRTSQGGRNATFCCTHPCHRRRMRRLQSGNGNNNSRRNRRRCARQSTRSHRALFGSS